VSKRKDKSGKDSLLWFGAGLFLGLLIGLPLAQAPASAIIYQFVDLKVLLSIGFGGVIAYVVSKRFFRLASEQLQEQTQDLKKETDRLTKIANAITRVMENAGLGKFARDEESSIATGGLRHEAKADGGIHAVGSAKARLIVKKEEPEKED